MVVFGAEFSDQGDHSVFKGNYQGLGEKENEGPMVEWQGECGRVWRGMDDTGKKKSSI